MFLRFHVCKMDKNKIKFSFIYLFAVQSEKINTCA